MRSVTAAEANRSFSKLLSEVKREETATITSHGAPIAKLVPFLDASEPERREGQAGLARSLGHPHALDGRSVDA